jgi:hypothetical protein
MKYIAEIISLIAWPIFIILALWLSNKAIDCFHKQLKKEGEEEL